MNITPSSVAFSEAIRRTDELLCPAYVPLAARLVARSATEGQVSYRLRYRSWQLIVRLRSSRTNDPDSPAEFSCRIVGSTLFGIIHDAIPGIDAGASVVGPLLLGTPRFEGAAESMSEVCHRVIHRSDVQRAIRRGAPWPQVT